GMFGLRLFLILPAILSTIALSLGPISSRVPQNDTSHTGSIEVALVGIEVVNAAAASPNRAVRHGNGFVIRCDGFILAPSELFTQTRTAGLREPDEQTVTVFLHPGTSRETR